MYFHVYLLIGGPQERVIKRNVNLCNGTTLDVLKLKLTDTVSVQVNNCCKVYNKVREVDSIVVYC